jgi:peptidyl-dipeptidase A
MATSLPTGPVIRSDHHSFPPTPTSCFLSTNRPDPFFQEPPENPDFDADRYFRDKDLGDLTLKTYDSLGLDVRSVMARSDLYGRSGKNQHAFCLSVGQGYPYDVRVLANLRPDAYWMNTMLHEFGHAVYDQHINPRLPYFLRTIAHTCTTEAIALMMGSLSDEPGWLEKVAGVPREELAAERIAARSTKTRSQDVTSSKPSSAPEPRELAGLCASAHR